MTARWYIARWVPKTRDPVPVGLILSSPQLVFARFIGEVAPGDIPLGFLQHQRLPRNLPASVVIWRRWLKGPLTEFPPWYRDPYASYVVDDYAGPQSDDRKILAEHFDRIYSEVIAPPPKPPSV